MACMTGLDVRRKKPWISPSNDIDPVTPSSGCCGSLGPIGSGLALPAEGVPLRHGTGAAWAVVFFLSFCFCAGPGEWSCHCFAVETKWTKMANRSST